VTGEEVQEFAVQPSAVENISPYFGCQSGTVFKAYKLIMSIFCEKVEA
jgi:hypothetical protein